MNFIVRRKKSLTAYLTVFLVPLALMLIYSCSGSSSYTVSSQDQTPVMVSAATLNNWVDSGYGTDANGYNKLVILDVDSSGGYNAGHIPGSYNLDTGADLQTTRSNGVSFTVSQVPTQVMMDDLIQRTGIDEHTVVAFVGNGTMMNVGRAYFNFRYWGFPKERLKVMDGTKIATYVNAAGYLLATTATPLPTPSTYSVASLTPDVSVRASMEEMIGYAQDDDPFTVIIDARSDGEYNGEKRSTRISGDNYVAFEGHVRTAAHQEYVTLHQDGNRANPLLPKNELVAAMAAINMDQDGTGISYCRTSWRAAIQFLALDAVLGWKAKIYDGAWIQWGQMADNDASIDGSLEPDSPWRTDFTDRSESINYNKTVVTPIPITEVESFAAHANLINENDKTVCATNPAAPPDRPVSVMVDPATLNGWVTGGYPDAEGYGYTKMVVLHVDSAAGYSAGHVPGAFSLDTAVDLSATRNNGIADTISQVPTQAQMDALIGRTGIDADTVIVFTTSPGNFNMMNLGRAYFNFRYWGFPKERLRIMDGNTTHYAAVADLSTVTPADVVSGYSVCDLRQDTTVDEVRASFEEMFNVAADDDPATVIADARSADEYNGVIGKTSVGGGAYVAFEGHARTAEFQEYVTLLTDDGKLLPTQDLEAAMTGIGAGPDTTVYTYCRTSWRAAVNFMALDAVLGWPVKIYDGAWIQWGQMATNDSSIGGSLDPDSPWRTDNDAHTEALSYNKTVVEPVGANSYAPHANEINTEDAGTAASGGGGGGAGSGTTPSGPTAPGYN